MTGHELLVFGVNGEDEVKLIHGGDHNVKVVYRFDLRNGQWVARVIPIVDDAWAAVITIRATDDGGAVLKREDWHYRNGTWVKEGERTVKVC